MFDLQFQLIASGEFSTQNRPEKFHAGAALIQLYTGLVYRGPQLLRGNHG